MTKVYFHNNNYYFKWPKLFLIFLFLVILLRYLKDYEQRIRKICKNMNEESRKKRPEQKRYKSNKVINHGGLAGPTIRNVTAWRMCLVKAHSAVYPHERGGSLPLIIEYPLFLLFSFWFQALSNLGGKKKNDKEESVPTT